MRVSVNPINWTDRSFDKKNNSLASFLNQFECHECKNYGNKAIVRKFGKNSPPFQNVSIRGMDHVESNKDNYKRHISTHLREADRMVHGGNKYQCLVLKVINKHLAYQSLKFLWLISLI